MKSVHGGKRAITYEMGTYKLYKHVEIFKGSLNNLTIDFTAMTSYLFYFQSLENLQNIMSKRYQSMEYSR